MYNKKIYIASHGGLLGSAILKLLKLKGFKKLVTKPERDLDLTSQDAVCKFLRKERIEYVFLSTGASCGIVANQKYPATLLEENLAIQSNFFKAAQKYEIKKLIFFGSSCMYPRDCRQPIKEEYLMTGPLEKTSQAYALTKILGIEACRAYNEEFGTNRFVALVPNSIYGPNDEFDPDKSHVIAALIRKLFEARRKNKKFVTLWGTGNPVREFVFSEDVASASIFAAMNSHKFENTHYNIASGHSYSIRQIAEIISKITKFRGEIHWDKTKPDGARKKILDGSKLFGLGWRPSTSLESGIKITCDWYSDSFNKKI